MKKLYNLALGILLLLTAGFSAKQAEAACASTRKVSIAWSNTSKCNTYNFEAAGAYNGNTLNGCLKFSWKIYNSAGTLITTSNSRTFAQAFTANGNYTVRLSASDTCNKCDTVFYKTLTVNCSTNCNWTGMDYSWGLKCKTLNYEGKNFNNGCLKYQFYVYNSGTNQVVTLSPGRTGSYTFPSNGTYTVKMSVRDTCKGCDTFVYKTITVSCTPCDLKPEFSWKADCFKVKFYGTINSSGVKWTWYFGDGSTGTGADPYHAYVKNGVYKVCAVATWTDPNSGETCKKEICKEIKINCGKPCELKGDFKFSATPNGVVKFGASSTGGGYYYEWDFGDGTTGSGQNLTHTYKKPGTYTVCVKISDKTRKCVVKICKTVVIENPCKVTGDFTWKQGTGGNNNSVKFYAYSTNGAFYEWSFGDGSTGTGKDPVHTYTKPGVYTVCVTIYSANKRCKIQICKKIEIKGCVLPTGWSQTITDCNKYIFDGYKVTGSNGTIYTNPCHKYSWDFGDGSKATGKVADHVFKNGTYNVCMTVVDTCLKCETKVCKTITVNCNKCNWAAKKPAVYFWDSCMGSNKNNSINGYIGFGTNISGCWKFKWMVNGAVVGYGRQISYPVTKNGTYTLCVGVYDTCNKCDTTFCSTRSITCINNTEPCRWWKQNPTIISSVKGGTISVYNNNQNGCVKTYWSLAGGAYTQAAGMTYTVTKNGSYVVCMKLIDTCKKCDTVMCKEIKVDGITGCTWWNMKPTLGYQNNCRKYSFYTTGSTDTCIKYTWTVDGKAKSAYGSGSASKYMIDSFLTTGNHTVCVKWTNTCKNCDTTLCITVKVDCTPCNVKANFVVDSVSSAGVAYVRNLSTGGHTYLWSWGDKTTSKDKNPGYHKYSSSGVDTICLTVYDTVAKCSATYCLVIKVYKTRSSTGVNGIVNGSFKVYPNPTAGTFYLSWDGIATQYEVLNMQGRTVYTAKAAGSEAAVNTAGWSEGVYTVRLQTEQGYYTTRVVITR
ncbi:MAG: PKD domain-containing protein [Bacteroidetes bacterium]|nr:PKD domain-containing protein [Bacteroidota bacterium]